VLVEPAVAKAALVVISGSSGRLEVERARILAAHGIAAYAFKWYQGMPAPLDDFPLETFVPALEHVRSLAPRAGILGTSFGAEIALLLATKGVPLDLVVALVPTSVVWQSPMRDPQGRPVGGNKWSWKGESLPGVPYVDRTTWTGRPLLTALDSHQASLTAFPGDRESVEIKVEEINSELLVSSGGADAVWQAQDFCRDIVRRRARHGLATFHVHHPRAGHRATLPGETTPTLRPDMPQSGGTPKANRAHGERLLHAILDHV
jgi:uncharacterized protein